jgi:hypothetical protein
MRYNVKLFKAEYPNVSLAVFVTIVLHGHGILKGEVLLYS